MNVLNHPWIPFALVGFVGLHYLIPHKHDGAFAIVLHMGAGVLCVMAFVLHIRNQLHR